MQLPLVLAGRPISHAIGAVKQVEAETPRPLSSANSMYVPRSHMPNRLSLSQIEILVSGDVAVHGRRAGSDLVLPRRLLGGDDTTKIDFRTGSLVGTHR